jgi:hypothetical protein
MEKETIVTKDLYEAGLYLSLGFVLEKIEVVKENNHLTSQIIISGEGISKKQLDYLNGEATTNIIHFRRSLKRLKSLVYAEQRKVKKQGGLS